VKLPAPPSIAQAERKALRRSADQPERIEDPRLGQAAPVRSQQRARVDADPFALRLAQQIDGEVRVDEDVAAEVEDRTDAVAGVRGDRDALQRARFLAGDQRMAQAPFSSAT
jgi:hypothetical protein